jgi:hypothetical protein
MQQLEIKYFYPLTEQIDLDLDFTPCIEYQRKRTKESQSIITNGSLLTTDTSYGFIISSAEVIKPSNNPTVGYYKINDSESLQLHMDKRPNKIAIWFNKWLLNNTWVDE